MASDGAPALLDAGDTPALLDAAEPSAELLERLRSWGWNSTSFQVTKPGFRYLRDGDATVAYVDTGGAWVCAGAPIGPDASLGRAVDAFVRAARGAGRRPSFFAVERRLLSAAPTLRALAIGQQPVWDPSEWGATVARARTLRSQVRRPLAKGVSARVADPSEVARDAPLYREIDALTARWLASRGMPPMSFLVDIRVGGHERERRYVVAERGGQLVGACLAVPIYARDGWFLENVLRAPGAPNGTAELLVDATMRSIAADGARYATLGLAPLSGEVAPWLRLARRAGRFLYDFQGLHAFKTKLCPARWDDVFLACPAGASRTVAVVDALTAFAGGSLVRFGLRAAAHLAAPRRARAALPARGVELGLSSSSRASATRAAVHGGR
ncbi:MAG: DUF2156 domain-containing protein [Polyangiaceae bacterium]|nr:DUF2156 domain-containing protein [Polyangiaceae bacterium]